MLLISKNILKASSTLSIMGPLLFFNVTKPPKLRPSKEYIKSPLADATARTVKSDQPFGHV